MLFIPAIDIRGGRVVRLIKGAYDQEIVYGDDPVVFAREFEKAGVEWLHVVDLDGALTGELTNLDKLNEIRSSTRLKIEFGGGLRSVEAIERVLKMGVDRVILGTKGLEESFLVKVLAKHYEKVAVSVDARDGFVQTQGWTQNSMRQMSEFLERLRKIHLRYLVYTNILRDGTLEGPDTEELQSVLAAAGDIHVILSGGVSSLNDLKKVSEVKSYNFYGVIVGRALYEKKFTAVEAVKTLQSGKK